MFGLFFLGLGILVFCGMYVVAQHYWWKMFPALRPFNPDVTVMLYPVDVGAAHNYLREENLRRQAKQLTKGKRPITVNVAPPTTNVAVGPVILGTPTAPARERAVPIGIDFEAGDPEWFDQYDAQPSIVDAMKEAIAEAVNMGLHALKKAHAFLGQPGLGKTLLAKIAHHEMNHANVMAGRPPTPFFETLATNIRTVEELDEVMLRCDANPGCTLFIDEFASLTHAVAEKLNPYLTGGRYEPQGQNLRLLNPFTLIVATTDFASMHPALQRRFVTHDFERMTPAQLVTVLRAQGKHPKATPIAEPAIQALVARTKFSGAPWEALRYYDLAVTAATARRKPQVTPQEVETVFDRYGIDDFGLSKLDRLVLQKVFTQPKGKTVKGVFERTHYSVSEETLIGMTGIERARWRSTIRPKLFSRGLMVSRQGQALTPLAEQMYGHLREK